MSRDLGIALTLLIATVGVYGQVGGHEFVTFDDDLYVFENVQVQRGLTWEGVRWAFAEFHVFNWYPLTWLSHMLDYELFGLRAGRHHQVSLAFHVVNVLLLFWLLRSWTGDLWPSAFVAGLFAVHPLRVESVAWVAERKDVLCGSFWLATLLAYGWYARAPGTTRYLVVALGLTYSTFSLPFGRSLLRRPLWVTQVTISFSYVLRGST